MSTRTATRLAATAVVVTMAWPAMAQDVGSLVTFRADNRSGSGAAAEVIALMIAERSQSAAVQNRARSLAPQGTLELGPTELLLDIGAHGHIADVTNTGAVVQPAVLRPATEPRPARVEPVAAPVVTAPARVEPAAGPATTPVTVSAPARPTSTSRRNWNAGGGISAIEDRGGNNGGGGGGGSGGGGGGGGSGGGGGGGWN